MLFLLFGLGLDSYFILEFIKLPCVFCIFVKFVFTDVYIFSVEFYVLSPTFEKYLLCGWFDFIRVLFTYSIFIFCILSKCLSPFYSSAPSPFFFCLSVWAPDLLKLELIVELAAFDSLAYDDIVPLFSNFEVRCENAFYSLEYVFGVNRHSFFRTFCIADSLWILLLFEK